MCKLILDKLNIAYTIDRCDINFVSETLFSLPSPIEQDNLIYSTIKQVDTEDDFIQSPESQNERPKLMINILCACGISSMGLVGLVAPPLLLVTLPILIYIGTKFESG